MVTLMSIPSALIIGDVDYAVTFLKHNFYSKQDKVFDFDRLHAWLTENLNTETKNVLSRILELGVDNYIFSPKAEQVMSQVSPQILYSFVTLMRFHLNMINTSYLSNLFEQIYDIQPDISQYADKLLSKVLLFTINNYAQPPQNPLLAVQEYFGN